MNNIELLKEFIKEIFLESNKPPEDLKTNTFRYCVVSKSSSKRLKKYTQEKIVKVRVKQPDARGPFSIVVYDKKNPSGKSTKKNTFSVATRSLKKNK